VFNLGVVLQTGDGGMQQQASKMKEEIQLKRRLVMGMRL
jgi:hypothetical protein